MNAALGHLRQFVSGAFISFGSDADLDAMLNARDAPRFEKQWLRVYDSVRAARQVNSAPKRDLAAMDEVSQLAFEKAFALTSHDDIAAQVSDDFLLLGGALVSGFEDEWLNALWLAYRLGTFPHKPLRPRAGRLADLIAGETAGKSREKKPSRHRRHET